MFSKKGLGNLRNSPCRDAHRVIPARNIGMAPIQSRYGVVPSRYIDPLTVTGSTDLVSVEKIE